MNNKKQEITNLENNFKSKISFLFDSQMSLHEPIVELEDVENSKEIKKIIKSKPRNNSNKKIIKKKTLVKKKKKILKKKTDITIKEKKDKKEDELKNNTKEISTKNENKNIENNEEKTGWWS